MLGNMCMVDRAHLSALMERESLVMPGAFQQLALWRAGVMKEHWSIALGTGLEVDLMPGEWGQLGLRQVW